MVVSPQERVAFVPWRLVALVLLGLGVHRSFAFLPTVISTARSVGSVPEEKIHFSYHGSSASAMAFSSSPIRMKSELASLFGPRHRYHPSCEDSGDGRYDMSLFMGLGFNKIIGNVRRREDRNSGRGRSESDEDEDEDDFDSITRNSPITVSQAMKQADKGSAPSASSPPPAPQASHSPRSSGMDTLRSVASRVPKPMDPEATPPKTVRMGEDPSTREVDVYALDKTESVQERINRVKAGKMTPEEKAAFLESVLTAGSTVDARKPVIRSKEGEKPVSASPFPTDSAFRNIARGKKTPVPNEDSLENSQKKKREYLNMVTNPNRFGPYKTYSQNFRPEDRPSPAPIRAPAPAPATRTTDVSGSARKDGSYPSQMAPPVQKTDYPSHFSGNQSRYASPRASSGPPRPFEPQKPVKSGSQDPVQPPMPNDLGARLGMAAMASEKKRRKELLKAEEARREQERQREKERQEFDRQAMELARQKQEEMTMRETEARNRRRQQEEEAARRKEQEKREAEERMAVLIKAQEEYWQKKLAAERASKAKLWGDQQKMEAKEREPKREESLVEKLKVKDVVAEKSEVEGQEKPLAPTEVEFVAPVPTRAPSPPSSSMFNPNEQYLVEQGEHDREEDWHHNQETIAREASKYSGRKPLNDIQTESQFIADQARRKSNIDHQRDEQLEKLRALNSPLPSPVKPARAMPPAPPFQERRSVLGYPSNFQPQKPLGTPFEPQKPTEAMPQKSDQLNSLFNSLNGDDSDEPRPTLDAIDHKATISDLRNKQKEDSHSKIQNNEKDPERARGNLFGSALKKQSPRESSGPPTRKGPIRMEVSVEEDDERNTDIKEAIRKAKAASSSVDQDSRSKKWGVDMSRFTDD